MHTELQNELKKTDVGGSLKNEEQLLKTFLYSDSLYEKH